MTRYNKILLTIFIVLLVALLGFGGWFILHRNFLGFSKISKGNLPGVLFGPKSAQKAAELSPDKIIYWTNFYRRENGLIDLKKNSKLTLAAQKKVEDMFAKQYFDHVSPSGVTPGDLVSSTGYQYKVTGENLALGDFKDEKDLVDAWMNSPGHRANILNKDYAEIGVAADLGKYKDWGTTWMAVQEFGKPLPNCDKPDENTLNDINSKKAQYESLLAEINSLNDQADAAIQKGNEIYKETHDASQAQPYWDQGTALRNQVKDLQAQADILYRQISSESKDYNGSVNNYNACIAS